MESPHPRIPRDPRTGPDLRVGDVERDDAARLLTDHLGAGRLDHDEFAQRMDRALRATHRSELEGLFADLPGRPPGAVEPAAPPSPPTPASAPTAWLPWAVGGLVVGGLWAGVHVAHPAGGGPMGHGGRHGHHGPGGEMVAGHAHLPWFPLLVALVALAVLAYVLVQRARTRPASAHHDHPSGMLTADQRAEIDTELRAGHRVRAIRLFRRATGAGLAEATAAVSAWERRSRARRP